MKKLIGIVVLFFASMHLSAQSADEVAQLRQIFGKEKKELIKQFMSMNETDGAKFWPLYDEYSEKRKALADDRIDIIRDYADQYANLTNDQAKDLGNRFFKNEKSLLKLQEKFYKKISKAVSPLRASQFMQAENYLNTTIRSAMQDAIPFIGEFKKLK